MIPAFTAECRKVGFLRAEARRVKAIRINGRDRSAGRRYSEDMLNDLTQHLDPHGLAIRGGFHATADDGLPDGTLILIGNLGGALWSAFMAARRDEPHPLDSWTRRVVGPIAEKLGAHALYPFDGPPWHPFQRWAQRAEGLKPSPVGPLMHPEYGPWHAYRAALLFPGHLSLPPPPTPAHPCESCRDQPCLSACPVDAVGPGRYAVAACVREVTGPDRAVCRSGGCAARRVCPVGRRHAYGDEQQGFHMAAFLSANGDPAP